MATIADHNCVATCSAPSCVSKSILNFEHGYYSTTPLRLLKDGKSALSKAGRRSVIPINCAYKPRGQVRPKGFMHKTLPVLAKVNPKMGVRKLSCWKTSGAPLIDEQF
jgi:hypothetical protein